jgi:WD domain, G-beta repeat
VISPITPGHHDENRQPIEDAGGRRRWFGRLPGSHPCRGAYVVGDPLTGHLDAVSSVAYSPDGNIVCGSDDRTLRLWPTYPDATSASCTKLTANMRKPAVAGLGVARHRLHRSPSGPLDRAGLAPCQNRRARRAFVAWSAGHRKCGIVLTANRFVDMDSRPSQLKDLFRGACAEAFDAQCPVLTASACPRRPSRKRPCAQPVSASVGSG